MLFYLLSADELRELLGRLGYALPPEAIPRTIEYYLARTSHGSTLSALVDAWVLARAHREQALDQFERALRSDVADIQGGTTAEGVHLGAMAGCVDLLQRCFAGLETRQGRALVQPALAARVRAAGVRGPVPRAVAVRPRLGASGSGQRRGRARPGGPRRMRGPGLRAAAR